MNYFYKVLEPNLIGRDWTCGDIHGMYTLFMESLKKTDFDFEKDRMLCVGDLVDRGKESYKSLQLLDNKWFNSILGNHELFCIQGNENDWMARSHEQHNNGGAWFYKLPEIDRLCIVEKFKQLPVAISTMVNGYKIGFVHADVFDNWNVVETTDYNENPKDYDRSPADFLVWSRDRATSNNDTPIKNIEHVFLGHTVFNTPKHLGNCSFIDTGAVFGGKFTIICINDFLREKHAKPL